MCEEHFNVAADPRGASTILYALGFFSQKQCISCIVKCMVKLGTSINVGVKTTILSSQMW